MSYASTVPYARDALETVLGNRAGLSGVKVRRELPRREDDIQSDGGAVEAIWLGRDGAQDVEYDAMQPFLTAAAPRWDESYTLWVTVQVMKRESVDTLEDAEKRAWALAYEIVGAVSADLTLGVSIASEVLMFEVRTLEFNDVGRFLDKAGAAHRIEVGLNCFGRLHIT